MNRFPVGGAASSYPATQVLLGARAGRRFAWNRPALDLGGILEFYSRHHLAGRIDFGDTVVWYGDVSIPPVAGLGGSVTPRTRNQLQWNVEISAWF